MSVLTIVLLFCTFNVPCFLVFFFINF